MGGNQSCICSNSQSKKEKEEQIAKRKAEQKKIRIAMHKRDRDKFDEEQARKNRPTPHERWGMEREAVKETQRIYLEEKKKK